MRLRLAMMSPMVFGILKQARNSCCVAIVATICLCNALHAEEPRRSTVDGTNVVEPLIHRLIDWLPTKTETILAMKGPIVLRADSAEVGVGDNSLRKSVSSFLFFGLATHFRGSMDELTLEYCLSGARNFGVPKSLGLMPFEGCRIFVFRERLDKAGATLLKSFRDHTVEAEEISGFKVLRLKAQEEDGDFIFYVSIPKPNVLLVATDLAYLRELLLRLDTKAEEKTGVRHTMKQDWQWIDRKSDIWAIRHFDTKNAKLDPSNPVTDVLRPGVGSNPSAISFAFSFEERTSMTKLSYRSGDESSNQYIKQIWGGVISENLLAKMRSERGMTELEISFASIMEQEGFATFLLSILGHGVYI